ncbi:MAG: ATP-grasp domain-containing protein, partial [bacterium]
VEKFIHGQEATCSIIQKKSDLKVLSILDININNNNNNNNNNINSFFDYESKFNNSIINTCTIESSKLPIFMQTMIKEIAKKIFVLLKCKDYANIDFIISDDDIYVLEVNTLPGLTENSLLCKALELNDYTLKNFLDDMIHQNIN